MYFLRRLTLFSYFLFLGLISFSQRCDTYTYLQKHPVNASHLNAARNSTAARDTMPNELITIPVVIHVIYNNSIQNISDEQILSQLQSLNNDYRRWNDDASNTPAVFASVAADTRITFSLAKSDPSGRPSSGIIRKYCKSLSWAADDGMKFSAQGGDNAWDSKRYLNIWVCNLSGSSLGYATLPGSEADKDGVVIQYSAFGTTGTLAAPFNKGRTVTHEIGHWLGLKHTWGDSDCGDDGIADTPPQQTYNNGCVSFPHISACSSNKNGDMFMNFMDFTDDACMNMFTQGQKKEMRGQFASGGNRNSFLASSSSDSARIQNGLELNVKIPDEIAIYPNPATKFISIQSNGQNAVGKIFTIFDLLGNEVMTGTLLSQKNTVSIDKLQQGVYIIKTGDATARPLMFIKQ